MISKSLCRLLVGTALFAVATVGRSEEKAAEAAHTAPHQVSHGGGHKVHIGEADVSEDPAEFKSDLAIYTLLVFLGLAGLLYKFAWGPITEGLERREGAIHDNLANAESARIKAEKMLAEHAAKLEKVQDEVRGILAEAKKDAEHTKTEIIATAQKEAEATRQRAVHDIERARDQALDELFNQVGRVVYQATEQVLGRSVTSADNDRLIENALSSFAQRKHP